MSETNERNNNALESYGPLLTVTDVTGILGVSTRTVYRLSETGELPCIKIGRRLYFPKAKLAVLFGFEERDAPAIAV